MVGVRLVPDPIVAVPGPLSCVHTVLLMVAPLFPVAVPLSVTLLTGNVMVVPPLALTVGATGVGGGGGTAASTITVTVAVPVSPLLSVAVSLNTYVPATRPDMVGAKLVPDPIVAVPGPLSCVHTVLLMVAPLFPVAVPLSVTLLTGNVMVVPPLAL